MFKSRKQKNLSSINNCVFTLVDYKPLEKDISPFCFIIILISKATTKIPKSILYVSWLMRYVMLVYMSLRPPLMEIKYRPRFFAKNFTQVLLQNWAVNAHLIWLSTAETTKIFIRAATYLMMHDILIDHSSASVQCSIMLNQMIIRVAIGLTNSTFFRQVNIM